MNQQLIDFYANGGPDNLGRTFEGLINITDEQFESSHDIIQWLFPRREPSKYNKDAPLLDDKTVELFKTDPECIKNLGRAFRRFESFLQNTISVWAKPRNHNLLRITRAIGFFSIVNQPWLARFILNQAMRQYYDRPEIGIEATKYWQNALKAR